ncbi:LytTR family DNA-binding domain-containing protein [Seonamhaeicola sp. ML3]|uniref:LytR/AlgR family response regulator transcription factor n=1 Tax=Seonamhaeicola sp. ML3 TaxID=2937786 RepID=UPI00200DC701|nr:LytTR family DNA-binding domain-containing protein [Seonamhaeicola sp. ML3]
MKKFNVLILDDDLDNLDLLSLYIKKYCDTIGEIFKAVNIEQALSYHLKTQVDIFILDIHLEGKDTTFDFLDIIKPSNTKIIFCTAYPQYAIPAVNNYNISSYLVKPIGYVDLVRAVKKCVETNTNIKGGYEQLNIEAIAVVGMEKIELIKFVDILYLEAEGRYTTFHLRNKQKKVASTNIGEYEKRLEGSNVFFRIHHKYLVNVVYIKAINKSSGFYCELIVNNITLPVAKRRLRKLQDLLCLSY